MDIFLISDANWESKIDHALRVVDLRPSFEQADYGPGLSSMSIILMCRAPLHQFKQRVRLDKASSHLSMDVMLDLPAFIDATHASRRALIAQEMLAQVGTVLASRKPKGFDSTRFLNDLGRVLQEQLNGPQSSRFDAFTLERATGY